VALVLLLVLLLALVVLLLGKQAVQVLLQLYQLITQPL
jgi:hypothetical protein